jgi:hypothetical protein
MVTASANENTPKSFTPSLRPATTKRSNKKIELKDGKVYLMILEMMDFYDISLAYIKYA